ncbi:MAG: isoleucine--tRNA ligase [bacterium]|nr:isoleucine--tRNA ligase [bacterium]
MDYSKTVNLPNTDFPMKADLPRREPEMLKTWEEAKLYQQVRQQAEGKPKFILHDGPPYANGHIHLGHALNKILKDIVVKYKILQGFDVPFNPGWDCHGLPVEHQLFKELKITKHEIDQVTFRQKARVYAQKFIDIQREEFKRLGLLADWDNPYITMTNEYEAAIIGVFKELVRKDYIYKGLKPVHWCATCETALAEAEVEYADHTSPSVYVKFPVKNEKDTYVLIWTTTPWTLPANVAVAFHPESEYAYIKTGNETWILAEQLAERVMSKAKLTGYAVLKKVSGKTLEGLKLQHPFIDREVVGILGDFVTMEDGTGVVHIAPGHGEEDYLAGKKYNLPIIAPVNDQGKFTADVKDFAGQFVFKANEPIKSLLSSKNLLVHTEEITHSYPHCWRCKKPVIFRATEQWFLGVDRHGLRQELLANIKKVTWVPAIGQNRIASMVEQRPDWCLSRQRYWGMPIPIFYCKECNTDLMDVAAIEAVENMVRREGSDSWYIKTPSEILPENIKCSKCGSRNFRKETDILDVWFDSGVSHTAVLKHPEIFPGVTWPSDMYLEGSDQHRGWFQTSLITSVAATGQAPYKTVLTHGFTVDGEGKKMSKSLGNVISPQNIYSQQGADIIRLWVSSEDYTEDARLSPDIIKRLTEAYRKIRNTVRYFLANTYDFDAAKDSVPYARMTDIDKWALHKLQELVAEVTSAYDSYQFHQVYSKTYNFCVVAMSSFYLDVLKDRLYTFKSDGLARRSAQTVLYEILGTLARLLAPIMSFTAEEIWRYIPGKNKQKSVFLASFPIVKKEYLNNDLIAEWDRVLLLRGEVSKALEIARRDKIINSSLEAKVLVYLPVNHELTGVLRKFDHSWPSILIVSQAELPAEPLTGDKVFSSPEITGLQIMVTKAEGTKCSRCWNYSKAVGQDKDHPEICERCLPVVMGKDQRA